MAKSKKRKDNAKRNASPAMEASPNLAHNPFASLSQLGANLPQAPIEQPAPAASPPKPKAESRFPGKLVLRREVKGRGGKTVTRLQGIAEPERIPLAKEMKKALGCGATVEGDDIVLLGSLVDRAATWLQKAGAQSIVKGN